MATSLIAGASPVFAEAAIPERPEKYVRDEAGVLSDREMADLDDALVGYSQKKKSRIDVLLVKTTDGESTGDYADRVMSAWRTGVIGQEQEPDAVIVAATDDGKIACVAGDGMKKAVPESELSGIPERQEVKSSIRKGDWSAAVRAAVMQIQRAGKKLSSAEKGKKKPLAAPDMDARLDRNLSVVIPVLGIATILAFLVHMLTGEGQAWLYFLAVMTGAVALVMWQLL